VRRPPALAPIVAAGLAVLLAGCASPRRDAERDLRAFYDARVRGDFDGAMLRLTAEGRNLSNSLQIRDYRLDWYTIASIRIDGSSGSAKVTLRLSGRAAAEADEELNLVVRDGHWRIARLQRSLLQSVAPARFEILALAVEPGSCRGPVRIVVSAAALGAVTDPPDLVTHVIARRGDKVAVVRVALTPRALRSPGTVQIIAIDDLRLTPGRYRITARVGSVGTTSGDARMEREFECGR